MERERWRTRSYFVFAALGSAVGLGNIWRFPYLAYANGGGVFLIPYAIGLIALGIPWLLVEYGMGRYFQRSCPGVFEGIGKKWEWLGWWPVWVAFGIITYYSVVMAWALRYVGAATTMAWGMGKGAAETAGPFLFGEVLQLSGGPDELGAPVGALVGCLVVVWIVTFLVMFRGTRVIGPVSKWTMISAWTFLAILVIRGVTLPGAVTGLNYYLTPDFSALGKIEIWFAAFSQIAFTLSLGMAGMYAYGSYVARRADINNNAVITSLGDWATAFFAGFAVFSIVGFVMVSLNIPVGEVSTVSVGLAFITWPIGISMMPGANSFFGVLFFLSLFLLGLTSLYFLAYGGVVAPLMDKFGWGRTKTAVGVCVISFLIGLIFTTNGGLYWGPDLLDRAVSFYGLLLTGALASIVVGWVLPVSKLREHINETSDFKVGAWFDWMVKVVVPLGLLFVVIYGGFAQDIPTSYGGYPRWASSFIWVALAVTLGLAFLFASYKTRGSAASRRSEVQ
jgi:NSS family neurotransmitter:Na+ symporter